MYVAVYVEYPLFLADFRKIGKYQMSRKFFQWEPSCSMRADRQTDRHDEANSHFSQLCERNEQGKGKMRRSSHFIIMNPGIRMRIA